jgi:predicted DNA-binding protein (MmcQ/YjbR family)
VSTDKRTDLQRSLEEFALSFPEAWSDTPWDGDQVTKVRKKIFAFYGTAESPGLTVKLPDSAEHALSFTGAEPTGYGLGRHGWVSIPIGGVAAQDAEVLYDFVEESYRAVAPKTLVKQLEQELDG